MALPPDPLAHAQRLLAAGRPREARALLEPLAAHAAPGVARQLAEIDIVEGAPGRALERLAPLDAAGDPEAAFLVARAHAALGEPARAARLLEALRARLPVPSAMLELHLAIALEDAGEAHGALAALRRAAALDPPLAAASRRLAARLEGAQRREEAREVLEQAVARGARDPGLEVQLASVQRALGDAGAALASLGRAAAAAPPGAPEWLAIGHLYAEHWRFEEADRALDAAAAAGAADAATSALRGVVKQELGDAEGALAALRAGLERFPDDLRLVLGERLMLPPVYAHAADAVRWRARYAEGLARTLEELPRWLSHPDRVFDLERNNFLLAYQGEDDWELQRRYSTLLARLAGAAAPGLRASRPRRAGGGRLRVGFAGTIFRDCTAGRYFERWVTGLDGERFERFVYHTAPLSDAFTQRIAGASEHFTHLLAGTRAIAERIAADGLDVLVHPEVGMGSTSSLLAALRLAPVQCAGWGHPVTTGSDAIDAYFTCAAMEPPDAAGHYVEPLVGLPGIGVEYAMPATDGPMPREHLGIAPGRRVYACPQSLFKVHPDMDALLARVLAADEAGVLLLFQAPSPAVTRAFAARLQGALEREGVPPRGQLKFLPRMDGASFRRVLAAADVVLDPVRWSGGNTSLDAFAAGTPVVALRGRYMRARQTAAMLDLMGLAALVADSPEAYARTAVEAARPGRNAEWRSAVAARRGRLFGDAAATQAFAEALIRLAAGAA